MKNYIFKIQTGEVCPQTGNWCIAEDGIGPSEEIKVGDRAQPMMGEVVTWYLFDDD